MLIFAICDDNPQFAGVLAGEIKKFCTYDLPDKIEAEVIPIFTSGNTLLDYIGNDPIDVLFLDVDMPDINGFEVAERIQREYRDTVIIFVSAYDDFVYSSFEYAPFRFLRKTKLSEELKDTLVKVVRKCLLNKDSIEINSVSGTEYIRVRDILYFENQSNYYNVYTIKKKILRCRGSMKALEETLADRDFFRVHSAYIVNLDNIDIFSNSGKIIMNDGREITVSRQRRQEFKEKYYLFMKRRLAR